MVIGNPPWDEVTIEELAFYALRDPGLRGITSVRERSRRIAELDEQYPEWRGEFETRKEQLATARRFLGEDGGYQLQGAGDTDLYQLFCERYTHLVREGGHLGVVLPRSAFLTKGAEGFRTWLLGDDHPPAGSMSCSTTGEVGLLRFTRSTRSHCWPCSVLSPPRRGVSGDGPVGQPADLRGRHAG